MPNKPPMDSPVFREAKYGRQNFPVAVSGVTSGTANAANLLNHGIRDANGYPFPAANLRAVFFPTSNAGQLYQGAAPTATQLDIRSAGTSVPFVALIFLAD